MIKSYSENADSESSQKASLDVIRLYWNEHIHDRGVTEHPLGTIEFFEDLEAYHFQKLKYLPKIVDFTAYKGRKLLELGCGIGTDLIRFAKHGAIVTGIDLAEQPIKLAGRNFDLHGLAGNLLIMNGEQLQFSDECFDVVYCHGVLQYTNDARRMILEIHRVLKRGGEAIFMVYNRHSWLILLSKFFGTKLEHENAPVFQTYSISEFRGMLSRFSYVDIIPERFPVRTRLHRGPRATLYNALFVPAFNMIPKSLVRPFGAHLIAKAIK